MDQPRELVGCSNYHTCSVCFLFPWKSMEVLKTKCIVRFSKLCKHPRAYHWTFDHPLLQPFPLVPSCILPPRQNTWKRQNWWKIDDDWWFIIDEVLGWYSFHFFVAPFCFSIAELRKLPQEHITSDIGSVGDFAAGSEVAFGTILQRTYSVLGARMPLRTSGYHEQTVSWGINVCFGVGLVSHLSLLAVWCFFVVELQIHIHQPLDHGLICPLGWHQTALKLWSTVRSLNLGELPLPKVWSFQMGSFWNQGFHPKDILSI